MKFDLKNSFLISLTSFSSALCPSGYFIENPNLSSCYQLINPGSWNTAVDICQNLGGWPVEITSPEEFEFLTMNIPYEYWIGLSGSDLSNWFWSHSGQVASYYPWSDGYPMDTNSMNCAYVSADSGGWKNDNCENSRYILCEFTSIITTTPTNYPTLRPSPSPTFTSSISPTFPPSTYTVAQVNYVST